MKATILDWGHQGLISCLRQQCPEFPFLLCNELRNRCLTLVLVIPGPVKTVSSNSFLPELLTGGASCSHGSWTKADHAWVAGSISQRWKRLIQCFPSGEEAKPSSCKHPIACSVPEHEDACSLQPMVETEQSSLWALGKTIPPFSSSLSQVGPKATCDSSLLPSCVLRMGRDFC